MNVPLEARTSGLSWTWSCWHLWMWMIWVVGTDLGSSRGILTCFTAEYSTLQSLPSFPLYIYNLFNFLPTYTYIYDLSVYMSIYLPTYLLIFIHPSIHDNFPVIDLNGTRREFLVYLKNDSFIWECFLKSLKFKSVDYTEHFILFRPYLI